MFQEPLLPTQEHFAWTFAMFASNGVLEHGDSRTVEGSEVDLILTHFLHSHAAMRFVSERVRLLQFNPFTSVAIVTCCCVFRSASLTL